MLRELDSKTQRAHEELIALKNQKLSQDEDKTLTEGASPEVNSQPIRGHDEEVESPKLTKSVSMSDLNGEDAAYKIQGIFYLNILLHYCKVSELYIIYTIFSINSVNKAILSNK